MSICVVVSKEGYLVDIVSCHSKALARMRRYPVGAVVVRVSDKAVLSWRAAPTELIRENYEPWKN